MPAKAAPSGQTTELDSSNATMIGRKRTPTDKNRLREKTKKRNNTAVKPMIESTEGKPTVDIAPIYWTREAITYLGLDRLGLARPDMAIQRLIKKGALRPKKIGGHLAFDKKDLERLIANGDAARRRGRPRKIQGV